VGGSALACIIVARVGRRSLLLLSSGLCCLFMAVLATMMFLKIHNSDSVIIKVSHLLLSFSRKVKTALRWLIIIDRGAQIFF
jgi:hypothetical protein